MSTILTLLSGVLTFGGVLAAILGEALFLATASKRSLGWALAGLTAPATLLLFVAFHPHDSARPLALTAFGLIVAQFGRWICGG